MLKNLSLVVGAALLLAACGASPSEESSESVGAVESASTYVECGQTSCGATAHATGVVCDSGCLAQGYACGTTNNYNAFVCVPNSGTYWQCGTGCDPGYHQTGLKCDTSTCGPYNCSNPTSFNMGQCAPDSADFYQCAGKFCPTGYSQTEWKCDPTSECGPCSIFNYGYNVRRCVQY